MGNIAHTATAKMRPHDSRHVFPYTCHSFGMGQGGRLSGCKLMEAFRWVDIWHPFSGAAG